MVSEELQQFPDPSIRRRRRLLFRRLLKRSFEDLQPTEQFFALQHEEDDPAFTRLSSSEEADEFRRRAKQLEFWHDDGYLGEHAVDLLGMALKIEGHLARRLFRLAQVQRVTPGPRRAQLTCYELLALYSVLKGGTAEERLQLLFCVFDADGDDRVGLEDLATTILALIELEEAVYDFEGSDLQDFHRVKGLEARKLADFIIKQYGSEVREDSPEDLAAEAEAKERLMQKAAGTSRQSLATTQRSESKPSQQPEGAEDKVQEVDGVDQAQEGSAEVVKEPTSKTQADAPSTKPQQSGLQAQAKAKAKPPPDDSVMQCCSLSGPKPLKRALNYSQWVQWLKESDFIPEGLLECTPGERAQSAPPGPAPLVEPPPADVPTEPAPVITQEPAQGRPAELSAAAKRALVGEDSSDEDIAPLTVQVGEAERPSPLVAS